MQVQIGMMLLILVNLECFFFNYGFLNSKCIFLLWIGEFIMLFLMMDFFNVECIF